MVTGDHSSCDPTAAAGGGRVLLAGGDLFAADAEALVNPVNTVGVAGAGLAWAFKRRFPGNHAAYQRACRAGELTVGRTLAHPTGVDRPRLIVNFPTKRHWRDPSHLDDLDAGLADLAQVMRREHVRSVAVPALGCGLGGLDWTQVQPRITAALTAVPGLHTRLYPPDATRQAARPQPDRREGPLPDTEPCAGCHAARHPSVGKTPCQGCGTVRWTLAITGSRTLTRPSAVLDAARAGLVELRGRMGGWPALVLHGDTPGVDRLLAAKLAAAGWPVQPVPANWTRGRQAGVLRDLSLIGRADALLAIWDGASRGTALQLARDRGLPIAGAIIRDGHRQPLPTPRTHTAATGKPATTQPPGDRHEARAADAATGRSL